MAKFSKHKEKLSARNQYLILSPRAAISAVIRRGMVSNSFCMPVCGREFHIACMRNQSSSFEAVGLGLRGDADQPNPTHA